MQQKYPPGGKINIPEINIRITPRLIYGVLAAVVVLWILSGIYSVDQQEEGVVRRFGKYVDSTVPGLNYHWPWPIERVDKRKVSEIRSIVIGAQRALGATVRYQQTVGASLMLTGDENIIDLNVIVQFRIKDAADYLFNVRNPDIAVGKASEAAIRFVIGKNSIDDALTEKKTEIQDSTRVKLQEILDSYNAGIIIVNVNLQEVQPPEPVAEAFRDVASAIQDKNKLINEAQGYRNTVIPTARGEAEQLIQEATGYKEERVRRAQGDIGRFLSILQEYNKSKDVTKKRLYIETMEKILPGMEKYIIESSGSGGIINLLQLQKGGN